MTPEEAADLLEDLTNNKYATQLPKPHQQYFTEKLLPDLNQGSEGPTVHLAMVLGYFDWVRENPGHPEREPPDDDYGALYDEMWARGMELRAHSAASE